MPEKHQFGEMTVYSQEMFDLLTEMGYQVILMELADDEDSATQTEIDAAEEVIKARAEASENLPAFKTEITDQKLAEKLRKMGIQLD